VKLEILRWFNANIGAHHVNHMCSRILYYRLPRVLREHLELRDMGSADFVAKREMRPCAVMGPELREADLLPRDASHLCARAGRLPACGNGLGLLGADDPAMGRRRPGQ
jgi:fatty acid desaturase